MRAITRASAALLVVLGVALASSAASAQFTYYRGDHVRNRPAHIGFSAIGGAEAHTHTGVVDGFGRIGLDVIGTLVPGFAIGFTRLGPSQYGYSDAEGVIFGVSGTPTFEFSFFPGANVQLLLQLGVTFDLGMPTKLRAFGVNAAVTAVIGVRFWLGNTFTFGILLGNDVGVTNPGVSSFFAGSLGQGELSFFGGLELGWNL
jgi:hypothetical protein